MNKKLLIILLIIAVLILTLFYIIRQRQKSLEEKLLPKNNTIANIVPVPTPTPSLTPTPAPTPTPTPSPAFTLGSGNYDFTLLHDGLTRIYKIYVPKAYDKNKATPMVIYIHGGGGSAKTAYEDGFTAYADKYGFILASPQGFEQEKAAEDKFSWNGGSWAGGQCCGFADDVGFISKMIDEAGTKFNIDKKRIFATGLSNGGLMTNRLACELADKIAAIATIAPAAVESDCQPVRPISVMDIHGTGDRCNPYNGGKPPFSICANVPYARMTPNEVVNKWLDINNCSDKSISGYQKGETDCIIYNQCARGAEVEFCTVTGMGHTWPSGSQYLPALLIGPVSKDISTDQIWEFFKKHPMK